MSRDLSLVWRDLLAVRGAGRRRLVDLRGARAHATPHDVRFVTDDVARFLEAIDAIDRGTPPREALTRLYLDRQTDGLREFRHRRPGGFSGLDRFVRRHRVFLASVRPMLAALHADTGWRDTTRAHLARLHDLAPDARFPDVILAVGTLRAPGTAGLGGVFLAAECFTLESADGRGLRRDERAALRAGTTLPSTVVHEVVHVLQRRTWGQRPRSLLDVVLEEGVADYLAALVTGEPPVGPHYAYGLAHEARLWREFVREADRPLGSRWLYEGARAGARPADLGYFVGYRIAQTYAWRVGDERRAVRDLLDVSDARALLRDSGYDGRGPTLTPHL